MTVEVPFLRARVPATSANLGPGFDSFGVAVGLHLTVDIVARGGDRVVTSGYGAEELPCDDRNLVWRALVGYCEHAGVAVPDVCLRVDNPIPLERGLGSSSAAAVAGIVLGRGLTGGRERAQDLIALAAEIEGHPDNAAAAVLGGLVVCVAGTAHRLEPADRLAPVVCVPRSRQSTEAARGLLPTHVPLADAAANGARAALLLSGLTGAAALHPSAMVDVLHEPPRFAAMTASGALVRALRGSGIAACLSGAGPSVLAVVDRADADAGARIRAAAGETFDVHLPGWDRAGAELHGLGAPGVDD